MNAYKGCSCGRTLVFLVTRTGTRMPVAVNQLADAELEAYTMGHDVRFDFTRHKAHFAECPDAELYRRRRGAVPPPLED